MIKTWILAGIILLAFGAARLPFEQHLDEAQKLARFRTTELDLSLRERVGQMGFLAALSGFRSFVAAVLWIQGHTAWENTEWGRMAGLFDTVTTLQPNSIPYWDISAWHMAWNASIAAYEDKNQPSEALRRRAQRQYFELGRKILEDGIRNNPEDAILQERMAALLRDKLEDHCQAYEFFARAADLNPQKTYLRRMAAYELAQCVGREEDAYALLLSLYNEGESQRMPSVIARLKELEEKLGIPREERIQEEVSP